MQTKLEASNLFLQGLVMWYGHDVMMIICDVWDVHYCIMVTGRILMVVFNLLKTCVSIHHVIALFQVVVLVAISDGQPWSGATDLDAMLVMMEIMSVLWRWRSEAQEERPYHITHYELHVMLILSCILFCLDRDGSIIRWSLSLNLKIIKCSSLVCTVAKTCRFEA